MNKYRIIQFEKLSSMKKLHYYISIILLITGCNSYHQADKHSTECPALFPDYSSVTFPVNIAPPNFIIQEEGEAYQTEIGIEDQSTSFIIHNDEATVCIPEKKWKDLLKQASGKNIFFRISILRDKEWTCYADIKNSISSYPIDGYLAYRLLYPGYELWNEMGIYQRDLSSYEETAIVENRHFNKQCVNCHTFNRQSPEDMMMHIRGAQGGTLIHHNGKIEKVNPKTEDFKYGPTYASWHPTGKFIAFSTNEIRQLFHSAGPKTIEVSDFGSDLMIYDVENHRSFTDPSVYGDSHMETFPAWAPDGKSLYFCRAQGHYPKMQPDSIRYDLCRISFDEKNEQWGTPEVVFNASERQKSVSFPCVSPDGKHLMFTLSDYGNFSIWHPESDLYLLDLSTGNIRNIEEVNSEDVDSYHTWSSDGRWFVFSSKRMDGLWARPYFASFDPTTGKAGKAFLLPQKNPLFYDNYTYTYNRPEMLQSPVSNGKQFEAIIPQEAIQAMGKH